MKMDSLNMLSQHSQDASPSAYVCHRYCPARNDSYLVSRATRGIRGQGVGSRQAAEWSVILSEGESEDRSQSLKFSFKPEQNENTDNNFSFIRLYREKDSGSEVSNRQVCACPLGARAKTSGSLITILSISLGLVTGQLQKQEKADMDTL